MSPKRRQQRVGFTLVELLVVIAIIVLMMALLLPAVQKVREAANKMHCGSHLKQIGVAIHNFYVDFNRFPTGGHSQWVDINYGQYSPGNAVGSTPCQPPFQTMGVFFQILPYIEQDSVFGQYQNSPNYTTQFLMCPSVINIYYCPSRRAPLRVAMSGHATTDYAWAAPGIGLNDSSDSYAWGKYDHHGIISRVAYSYNLPTLFGGDTDIKITFASVTDGSSNTLLMADKFLQPTEYIQGNPNYDWEGWCDGWDDDVRRFTCYAPAPDQLAPPAWTADQYLRFGSAHPGGVNALWGDSSVRSVPYDVSPVVFWRLGSRDDGVPVQLE